jgi:hypothetical protein
MAQDEPASSRGVARTRDRAERESGARALPLGRLWWPVLTFAAPLLLALATYWSHLDDFFTLDDFVWLLAVQDRNLGEVIVRGFQFPDFTDFDAPTPFFRPLTDVAFKLEEMAFGLEPAPYHAVNILLHVAVAGMGGLLTARMSGSRAAGVAVAAVFAVYPAYDVAVTWISQLSELLGAFFSVLALLLYREWLVSHHDAGAGWGGGVRWCLAGAIGAAALAALSKESQLTIFALVPLLALATDPRRRSNRELMWSLAPFAVLGAAHAGFLVLNEYLDAAEARTHAIGWHMFEDGWRYLRELALPFWREASLYDGLSHLLVGLYVVAGLTAIVLRSRAAVFFFVWSIVALAPFAISLQILQPRYTYLAALPFLGFIACFAVVLAERLEPRLQTAAAAAAGVAVAVLVVAGARATRDAQSFIEVQARNFELMIEAVENRCGDLPPGSRVSIANAGVLDPFGVIVPATINVFHDDVYAAEARRTPANATPPVTCEVDVLRDAPHRP